MPESTVRPLKCRFCWRRYKYEPCLEHHVRQVHQDALNQIMYRKYLLNLRLSILHQLRKAKEASEKSTTEKMEIETIESNSESDEQAAEQQLEHADSSSSNGQSNGLEDSEIQIIKVEPHEEFETRRSVIMHTSDINNK